jgi:ribonuclease D
MPKLKLNVSNGQTFVPTEIRKLKYPERISKEEINLLPIRSFPGSIKLVDTQDALKRALGPLRRETILGFDTETKPAFRKGVSHPPALIQLATAKTVYLIRLAHVEELGELINILSNPNCYKVGVAVRDDIVGLQRFGAFQPGGFIDIGQLAGKLGIQTIGLRSLTAIFLQFRISKKAQVSNWARRELSESQIHYAATDAWVSRKVFLKLRRFNRLAEELKNPPLIDITPQNKTKKNAHRLLKPKTSAI